MTRFERLGLIALGCYPPVGLSIFALIQLFGVQLRLEPAWRWLILPPLAVALVWGFVSGTSDLMFALDVALLLAAAVLLRPTEPLRSRVAQSLLLGLVVLLGVGVADRIAVRTTWQSVSKNPVWDNLYSAVTGQVSASGTQVWRVEPGTYHLRAHFQARLAQGAAAWNWSREGNLSPFDLTPQHDPQVGVYTRARFPADGGDPYLFRSLDLGRPLGGERVRVTTQLRSTRAFAAEGLRGVWLQETGSYAIAYEAVSLVPSWREVSFEWDIPDTVTSSVLRVVLNDFDGLTIDIGKTVLERWDGTTWQPLGPLAPTGMVLSLRWPGQVADHEARWLPEDSWQDYELAVKEMSLQGAERVSVALGLERSLAVEIRDLQLVTQTPGVRDPQRALRDQKQRIWFNDPNLAGHTAMAITGGYLLLQTSLPLSLVGGGVGLAVVALTGSRAAWVGLWLCLFWVLWLRTRGRQRRYLLVGVTGAAALLGILVLVLGPDVLGRFRVIGVDTATRRLDVWHAAWQAFREQPLFGLGSQGFTRYWLDYTSNPLAEPIGHAHNFWLATASAHGLFGVFVALWLSGGLLYLAWYRARSYGLALAVPILLMNTVDYTLFYAGVVLPLVLVLNVFAQAPSAQPDAQADAHLDTHANQQLQFSKAP